jgi:hypothetical protein
VKLSSKPSSKQDEGNTQVVFQQHFGLHKLDADPSTNSLLITSPVGEFWNVEV